ncbi:MAG: hypothetical protein MZV63_46030 [Marinilabiliales bacterium]|nr:hypothetical protein [Marinilabiliales bacterium]
MQQQAHAGSRTKKALAAGTTARMEKRKIPAVRRMQDTQQVLPARAARQRDLR